MHLYAKVADALEKSHLRSRNEIALHYFYFNNYCTKINALSCVSLTCFNLAVLHDANCTGSKNN